MKQSKLNLIGLAFAAAALAGCASPRSFDPNEGGQSYGDTSYSIYQSCLNALVPLGQGAGCNSNSAGGQSRNSYMGSGNYGYGLAGGGHAIKVPTYATSPDDAYFAFMREWTPEARAAQEQGWRDLAAQAE